MVWSTATSSISFLIAVCGSVKLLVCGSIAPITMEMLAATASYSAKSLNPCFLVTVSSSASNAALDWSTAAACIFSTTADMSFWAAMKPWTCFSVSLIWAAVICADATVAKQTTAAAAMVLRRISYMAGPPGLRKRGRQYNFRVAKFGPALAIEPDYSADSDGFLGHPGPWAKRASPESGGVTIFWALRG